MRTSPLLSLQRREMFGLSMPTLSSVEVFLRQGLHAYKDVCSQFFRVSLLVDFYRHVLFYQDDDTFWTALHRGSEGKSSGSTGTWRGYTLDHASNWRVCTRGFHALDGRPIAADCAPLGNNIWPKICAGQFPRQQTVSVASKRASSRRYSDGSLSSTVDYSFAADGSCET